MRITFKNYEKLMPLGEMRKSPHQRNKHGQEQIDRLAKMMRTSGVRHPIHISNRSNTICFGHGRREAALANGWKEYPVVFQDFESDEEEYACVQSDNAIATWSELDLSTINKDLGDLGPDFDIDLLGLKNFYVDASEKIDADAEWANMPEFKNKDKTAHRTILVHFYNDNDVRDFSDLVSQSVSDKTKFIWYPEAVIDKVSDKVYD